MKDAAVLVVVHPAGRLDDVGAASYWTEVPSLPACHSQGASVEEVVERTREAIAQWGGPRELRVELAF
ncbi:MAG: type II toxin-antitoxin system HicB family antitoxin [Chloroflexi bacterium]|nr:type II toxin-antitoxin system HicB family antitoxin [Chloroflexota bacterium]